MSNTPSFKQYLSEYDRYFNSFSEVIDKHDSKKKDARKKADKNNKDCEEIEDNDGEEDLDPCKFRQWMEISIAGD